MYEKFYGFTLKPFQTIPNPEVFYPSPKHENALTYLEYGIMERTGFILLTGEIGSGKTTLVKYLLNKIEPEIDTALIFNTNVTAEQLIGLVLSEFELGPCDGGKPQALDALYRFLIERFARNRRVLLIIDEAQNLSRDALEEVRMLSNLQSDDQMLLQIMLVGQPELRSRLKRPDLAQLNQRITVAYHLPALTREETEAYIGFRLEKAGGKPDLFTKEAVDLIYSSSNGIPRTINIICDTALVYGFADELNEIDAALIQQVIEDREGMGLVYMPLETSDQRPHAGVNNETLKRLKDLEDGLNRLEVQMETRMGELEEAAQGLKGELIHQLKELYERERGKNDTILIEYTRLKDKYLDLIMKRSHKSSDHEPVPDKGFSTSTMDTPSADPEGFNEIREKIRKEADVALKDLYNQKHADAQAEEGGRKKGQKKKPLSWFKS